MKPTTADWKELQGTITQYTNANLKIDGYDISIGMETDRKKMKLSYMVWVNGEFNGNDMRKDSEIGKRFYMRQMAYMYPKKFRDKVKKSRLYNKQQKADICTPFLCNYSPSYTSFNTMKKVFIDNNENIEIIKKIVKAPMSQVLKEVIDDIEDDDGAF